MPARECNSRAGHPERLTELLMKSALFCIICFCFLIGGIISSAGGVGMSTGLGDMNVRDGTLSCDDTRYTGRIQGVRGVSYALLYEGKDADKPMILYLLGCFGPRGSETPPIFSVASDGLDGIVPASVEPEVILPQDAWNFNPEAPFEDVIEWLSHPDARMRLAALEAVATHRDDARSWRMLGAMLQDPEPSLRRVAVTQLSEVMDRWPAAEILVLGALDDPVPSVQHLARLMIEETRNRYRGDP